MLGLLAFAAGSATAVATFTGMSTFKEQSKAQEKLDDVMLTQLVADGTTPTSQIPIGALPLDALPEAGAIDEPGSARPAIRFKDPKMLPKFSTKPSAKLVIVKSDKVVKETKDPIWNVQLVGNDNIVLYSLPALIGRANKQTANRNIAGNKSPLPKGVYNIDKYGIERGPFEDPELGNGYWIPITPLFSTNRSALGFHVDPSWGKRNGESGTSGCIGLQSTDATMKLLGWIRHFNIQNVYVES